MEDSQERPAGLVVDGTSRAILDSIRDLLSRKDFEVIASCRDGEEGASDFAHS